MFKRIFMTVLILALGVTGVGYIAVSMGLIPANADSRPSRLETWIARKSLKATLRRQIGQKTDPLPVNDTNLMAGIKLYEGNCLVCHGASDGHPSNIARGLYQ